MNTTWTHEQVRAWIERHGGNLSAAARRLRWPRSQLTAAAADPAEASSARPVPPPLQVSMESIDEIEALRSRLNHFERRDR